MQAAGRGEHGLSRPYRGRQSQHDRKRHARVVADARDPLANGRDAVLAAQPASRGGAQDAPRRRGIEPTPARGGDVDDVVAIASGRLGAMGEDGHVVHRRDDALREQQAGRQVEIIAGRPHGDDQALAGDPDLQRLLGDHQIAIGGPLAGGARVSAPLDAALDDAHARLRPDGQRSGVRARAGVLVVRRVGVCRHRSGSLSEQGHRLLERLHDPP